MSTATFIMVTLAFLCIFGMFFILLGRALGIIKHITIPILIGCGLLAVFLIASIALSVRNVSPEFIVKPLPSRHE